MNDPIFLELFSRLREAGLPLGTADYHLLERALQSGIQIDSRTQLAQICCMLWVKSDQERLIFDDYFDQLIPDIAAHRRVDLLHAPNAGWRLWPWRHVLRQEQGEAPR